MFGEAQKKIDDKMDTICQIQNWSLGSEMGSAEKSQ
jgi:hypothetical protein